MSAIFTNNLRVFNANQFINSLQKKEISSWQTGVQYYLGDLIYNSAYKYIATSDGISGATPPTHTTGIVSDGSVDWLAVEPFILNLYYSDLYIGIGYKEDWPNEPTPDTPVDRDNYYYSVLSKIVALKKITSSNVKLAVKRYNWVSGTIYNMYDPSIVDFDYVGTTGLNAPFYVLNSENRIYKCLNNNGGIASTSMPTGTSLNTIITGDGYQWKFMAEVSASDAITFLNESFIPVEFKLFDDGSIQYDIQNDSKKLSLSTIKVTAGGTGYTSATVSLSAPDLASGTQATANVILSGGVVTGFELTNIGSGYTSTPTVTISGDGTGASAEAILSPKDGHGNNILEEMNAKYLVISQRLESDEGGYFPVAGDTDFRQIVLISDPLDDSGGKAKEIRYLGPNHPDYVANPNTLNKIREGSGTLLTVDNFTVRTRTTGQIEDIRIGIKY